MQSDYGDDLLVQTVFDDLVDPYRIAVQVKGTRNVDEYATKSGRLRYPAERGHLIYWTRNRGMSIFVLWDVRRDKGWYCVPRAQYTDYSLFTSNVGTLPLVLTQTFDVKAAKSLAWAARLEHYAELLVAAAYEDRVAAFNREVFGEAVVHVTRMPSLTIDLLKVLGVVTETRKQRQRAFKLSSEFEELFAAEFERLIESGEKRIRTFDVALLALMRWMEMRTGTGISHALIEPALSVIEGLVPAELWRRPMSLLRPKTARR